MAESAIHRLKNRLLVAVCVTWLFAPVARAAPDPQSFFPHPQEEFLTKVEEFTVATSLYANEQLKFWVRIPLSKDRGQPGPYAHNVVFYSPYPGEKRPVDCEFVRFLTDVEGFTVLTIDPNLGEDSARNVKEILTGQSPAWGNAVEAAQAELVSRYDIGRRKLFGTGPSYGGARAANMALLRPDLFDAVAIHGASEFVEPGKAVPPAWLILNGRGDSPIRVCRTLADKLESTGAQVLFAITPLVQEKRGGQQYNHFRDPYATAMMQSYLKGAALERDENGAIDPSKWPYQITSDVIPRAVPLATKAASSPRRVYLPSPAAAYFFEQLPSSLLRISERNNAGSLELMAYLPGIRRLRGTVFYTQQYGVSEFIRTIDDIGTLADAGFASVASRSPGFRMYTSSGWTSTSEWINRQELLCGKPMVAMTFGDQSRSVCALPRPQRAALAAIVAVDPRLEKADVIQFEETAKEIPTLLLLDEASASLDQNGAQNLKHLIQTRPPSGGVEVALLRLSAVRKELKWNAYLNEAQRFIERILAGKEQAK